MENEPNRWKAFWKKYRITLLVLLALFVLYGWPGLWRYRYELYGRRRIDRITGTMYRYDRNGHWEKQ